MTRTALCASLIAVATACASAGSGSKAPSSPGHTRIITTGSGMEIQLAGEGPAAAQTVPASPDQVWAALPGIYETLGITGGAADPAARTYGNRKLVVRRRLGDQALSRYFRCGTNSFGAPVADTHRILLSVTTSVRPAAGGGSQLQTEVSASGQNVDGTSTEPVRCASTGVLESRIVELINA